jgi:hypothetical protein
VRTGAGAAVGVVTESVNVHAALGVGVVAGDVPGDLGVGGLGGSKVTVPLTLESPRITATKEVGSC